MIKLPSLIQPRPWYSDLGLLLLRVGVGLMLALLHGYGKLTGGPDLWEGLGKQMQNLGIDFLPTFWGFMAMFSEFFCSLLVVLGLFFRPAAALVVVTMLVAAIRHLSLPPDAQAAGIGGASHALELMAVFLALYFTGPGRFTIVSLFKGRRTKPSR